MPDQRKTAKVQTGNPPAGRLSNYTFTRDKFMRDLKRVATRPAPKK